MGYANAVSLDRLKAEVTRGGYDAVIHVGGKTGGGVGRGSLSWFHQSMTVRYSQTKNRKLLWYRSRLFLAAMMDPSFRYPWFAPCGLLSWTSLSTRESQLTEAYDIRKSLDLSSDIFFVNFSCQKFDSFAIFDVVCIFGHISVRILSRTFGFVFFTFWIHSFRNPSQ